MLQTYAKSCLLCLDRTGSNYLSDILARTDEVEFHNELFHRSMVIWSDGDIDTGEAVRARNADPIEFLKRTYSTVRSGKTGVKHVGFKLFINHNAEALDYIVSEPDINIVLLARQNYLARYSSFKIAEGSGRWKERGTAASANKVEFFFDEFSAYMENARCLEYMARALLARRKTKHLEVEYSQLKHGNVLTKVSDFLDVPPLQVSSSDIVKQNTSRVSERFSNEKDVLAYLDRIGKLEWSVEN